MNYKFSMKLEGTDCSRVVTVPEHLDFEHFHDVVNKLFDFDNSHPWQFFSKECVLHLDCEMLVHRTSEKNAGLHGLISWNFEMSSTKSANEPITSMISAMGGESSSVECPTPIRTTLFAKRQLALTHLTTSEAPMALCPTAEGLLQVRLI